MEGAEIHPSRERQISHAQVRQNNIPSLVCAAAKNLVALRAAALNEYEQYDDANNASHYSNDVYSVHCNPPFPQCLKNLLKDSAMIMIAGPRVTRNKDGKMKRTSGKTSLTLVFAACSSTVCRRWVLSASE